MNPEEKDDFALIDRSLNGDEKALVELLKKHQTFIYNVAINLTADINDAADLTQEVLIKVVTNLSNFEKRSKFRTWLFRIVNNHFLNTQRSKKDRSTIPWEEFAKGLDETKNEELSTGSATERESLIEEAKMSCMKAMLLCLTPEQRLIFVMGELFEIPDSDASRFYSKRICRS